MYSCFYTLPSFHNRDQQQLEAKFRRSTKVPKSNVHVTLPIHHPYKYPINRPGEKEKEREGKKIFIIIREIIIRERREEEEREGRRLTFCETCDFIIIKTYG